MTTTHVHVSRHAAGVFEGLGTTPRTVPYARVVPPERATLLPTHRTGRLAYGLVIACCMAHLLILAAEAIGLRMLLTPEVRQSGLLTLIVGIFVVVYAAPVMLLGAVGAVALHGVSFGVGLRWLRRIHQNLFRLGALSLRPSLSVWPWFVPGLNLVMPIWVINHLWEATQLDGRPEKQGLPLTVQAWWGFWVAAWLLRPIAWTLLIHGLSVESNAYLMAGVVVQGLALLAPIVFAALTIHVMPMLQRRHDARLMQFKATHQLLAGD